MFLRSLTLTVSDDELELPGRYDAAAACRMDARGTPAVLSAAATHTGTETKGMRDPADVDDEPGTRHYLVSTVTKEAGRDRDPEASTISMTITKTGGGRDTDDERAGLRELGTQTRGGRDTD